MTSTAIQLQTIPNLTPENEELLRLCDCEHCPLLPIRRPVFGSGTAKNGIVIVGEAPGRNEYEKGEVFVGAAGQLLDATLGAVGIERKEVHVTNMVLCRPTTEEVRDDPPPVAAIHACKPRLFEEVKRQNPKVIVTLGSTSSQSFLNTRDKISDLVASFHYIPYLQAWVAPTYHPAAVLHGSVSLFDDILAVLRRVRDLASGAIQFNPNPDPISYSYTEDPVEAREMLLELLRDTEQWEIALDIETDNLRYLEDALLLVTMSTKKYNYVFDPKALASEPANMLFCAMMEDPSITWFIHNMAFDLQFINYHFGTVPTNVIDTMAMALGTTERSAAIGLKRLAREYLNAPFYEQEIQQFLRKKNLHYSEIPRDKLIKYGAYDTHYTIRLPEVLSPIIEEENAWSLIHNVLIPAQKLFFRVETYGVAIDKEWAAHLESLWKPQIEAAAEKLADYAEAYGFNAREVSKAAKSPRLNINSSKQLIHFFYDVLGYHTPTKTTREKAGSKFSGIGKRTTSGDFIYEYMNEPPVQMLRTFRQLNKLLNTYVYGILDDVWIDGRIHPRFKLAAAATGRLAITNPPLQTIPHWGLARLGVHATEELATQVRGIFIASPGYKFVEVDYSQLELRIAWHYSKDEALGLAITSGDFHSHTAAAVLHKPLSEVTKSDRFISKFVTFGVMYGRQAKSLARGELQCEEWQAQEYVNMFWSAYPKYAAWWNGVREFVVRNGYVRSNLGRKRRWNLITRESAEAIKNQAVNMPIQSTASDLCLTSAIRIHKILEDKQWGHVLFLVHDSIVYEIKEQYLMEACRMIKREMTTVPFPTCAVFDVEVGVGDSWATCKEIDVD